MYRQLTLTNNEINQYTFVDPNKHYTRNLIATDNKTYTLLLLCWNPNHSSPIHDHPCDGCWMKVVQGNIREQRYTEDTDSDLLMCVSDRVFKGEKLIQSCHFHLVFGMSKN